MLFGEFKRNRRFNKNNVQKNKWKSGIMATYNKEQTSSIICFFSLALTCIYICNLTFYAQITWLQDSSNKFLLLCLFSSPPRYWNSTLTKLESGKKFTLQQQKPHWPLGISHLCCYVLCKNGCQRSAGASWLQNIISFTFSRAWIPPAVHWFTASLQIILIYLYNQQ